MTTISLVPAVRVLGGGWPHATLGRKPQGPARAFTRTGPLTTLGKERDMDQHTTENGFGQGHTTRSGLGTYGRTPRDLLRDPSISMNAKAVFGLLEDYSSPDRPRPFPAAATLAGFLGCSVKTVRRALRELRNAGWIRSRARATEGGAQTSNEYELCPVSVVTGDPPGHESPGGVVRGVQGPWSGVTNEEEPVEEEPLKKATHVSVANPNHHGVTGNEWEDEVPFVPTPLAEDWTGRGGDAPRRVKDPERAQVGVRSVRESLGVGGSDAATG